MAAFGVFALQLAKGSHKLSAIAALSTSILKLSGDAGNGAHGLAQVLKSFREGRTPFSAYAAGPPSWAA